MADLFGQTDGTKMNMTATLGGAPFNAAVGALRAGAAVCFEGRVGDDVVGGFLEEQAGKIGFAKLTLQKDKTRNTTLAFVALSQGERSFSFFRNDTADIYLDIVDLTQYMPMGLSTFHIGTLMLSEDYGRVYAVEMLKQAKLLGVKTAVDANFRDSLFASEEEMLNAFGAVFEQADILKLSDDEICLVANTQSFDDALARTAEAYKNSGKLIAVTAGSKGSYFLRGGGVTFVPAERVVVPVDTTGAGDAFFGALLAGLDGKDATAVPQSELISVFKAANAAGAAATQHLGAI